MARQAPREGHAGTRIVLNGRYLNRARLDALLDEARAEVLRTATDSTK